MIRRVFDGKDLLGIVVRASFQEPGIHFLTPNDFSQQVGYMRHPPGKLIDAHFHNKVAREVFYTQEVLYLRSGKLRVDFYDNTQQYVESHVLNAGDLVLLTSGGHGFEVLEEVDMIEIKQGPWAGDRDKTRFPSVEAGQLKIVTSS